MSDMEDIEKRYAVYVLITEDTDEAFDALADIPSVVELPAAIELDLSYETAFEVRDRAWFS